jgi:hypothetical protein
MAMAFVLLAVASDGIALILALLVGGSGAEYARLRMAAEVEPTLVHILGIAIFAIGLAVVDPRAVPVRRHLNTRDRKEMAVMGAALAMGGLAMKMVAMYLWGLRSLGDYLNNLYLYDFKVRSYAFLDQGVPLSALGFVLLAIAADQRRRSQALYLGAGVVVSLVLSLSKSGITQLILPFYLLAQIYSPATLRAWMRTPVLVATGLLFLFALGVKTQVKYRGLELTSLPPSTYVDIAVAQIEARFSGSGLFKKFSYLQTRIVDDPTKALHGQATEGIIAGMVPRFVYEAFGREKPPHPFYARGELVQEDRHVDLYANDAPSFVGAAFADAGYWSLVPVLLFGGVALALIRIFWTTATRSTASIIGYVYVVTHAGPSLSESGFLNLLYFLLWGCLLTLGLQLVTSSMRRSTEAVPLDSRDPILT